MTSTTQTEANLDRIKNFLSIMDKDIQTGHLALDCGTHTSLTESIAAYYKNPIMSMIETGRGLDDLVKSMVVDVFDKFMHLNKALIGRVYKLIDKASLHYFVVLTHDSFETRDAFFQFLDQYESLGIDHKLPVHVQFLTPTAVDKMKGVQELLLNA